VIFVGIAFIIVGLVLLLGTIIAVVGSEYFIISHRIYVKYGLIARHVYEIKNEWVTGVIIEQGFLGRLLNYGDLIISTPEQYSGSVIMRGVSDSMYVRTVVEDVLRRRREARKLGERIREKEYEFGRIPGDKYGELKRKYEEEQKVPLAAPKSSPFSLTPTSSTLSQL